ncbi:uncharacterized protein CLUP02_13024 [Colletotrichum lupini]|uniref:Uncharacterized protein n=1 Tax=Colletotrichum lupini TaxID=145971 RepID=A0A9Q8WL82_9PEZI|nr:uncharacterized protein CLUP02_13024 [Colletotrichum lupini]UQC87519.1 hypothetical protein CLUP02_13024 [Colletotrichum lupini]
MKHLDKEPSLCRQGPGRKKYFGFLAINAKSKLQRVSSQSRTSAPVSEATRPLPASAPAPTSASPRGNVLPGARYCMHSCCATQPLSTSALTYTQYRHVSVRSSPCTHISESSSTIEIVHHHTSTTSRHLITDGSLAVAVAIDNQTGNGERASSPTATPIEFIIRNSEYSAGLPHPLETPRGISLQRLEDTRVSPFVLQCYQTCSVHVAITLWRTGTRFPIYLRKPSSNRLLVIPDPRHRSQETQSRAFTLQSLNKLIPVQCCPVSSWSIYLALNLYSPATQLTQPPHSLIAAHHASLALLPESCSGIVDFECFGRFSMHQTRTNAALGQLRVFDYYVHKHIQGSGAKR